MTKSVKKNRFRTEWKDTWYEKGTPNELQESYFLDVSVSKPVQVHARAWVSKKKDESRYHCLVIVGSVKHEKQIKSLYRAKTWCCNTIRGVAMRFAQSYNDMLRRIPANIERDDDVIQMLGELTL